MVTVSFRSPQYFSALECEQLMKALTKYNRISDEVLNNMRLTVVLRCRDHGLISLATSSSPTLLFPLPFFHNTRGTDALGQ